MGDARRESGASQHVECQREAVEREAAMASKQTSKHAALMPVQVGVARACACVYLHAI